MSLGYFPESVTKEVLFKRAQERFQSWARMYGDPHISAAYMYEDMSASCYCGAPQDDFPDAFKPEEKPVYQYDDEESSCFFMMHGIKFDVYSLRSMRSCPRVNKETYTDVCVVCCDYKDENDCWMIHVLPDAWLYGSTGDEFEEYKPVHSEFIKAADKFIEKYGQDYLIKNQEEDEDEEKNFVPASWIMIMDNVCELQDFLADKLSDDDYTKAKDILDSIYNNAYAIKGDM